MTSTTNADAAIAVGSWCDVLRHFRKRCGHCQSWGGVLRHWRGCVATAIDTGNTSGHTRNCKICSAAGAGAAYPAGAGATRGTARAGAMLSSTGLAGVGAMYSTTSAGSANTARAGAMNSTNGAGVELTSA